MSTALPPFLVDAFGARLAHWCTGCDCAHAIPITRCVWNGDVERPTIQQPVRHFLPALPGRMPETTLCSYSVRRGQVHYSADCTHSLAGATVSPGWPQCHAASTGVLVEPAEAAAGAAA